MQPFRQAAVDVGQKFAKQLRPRLQGSQGHRENNQDGREDGQDTLDVHMNSFSPFRPSYKPATKSP